MEYDDVAVEPPKTLIEMPQGPRDAFLDTATSSSHYYIFSPLDILANGGYCGSIAGAEVIAQQYNLKDQGTCFVNDPGVFEVIEVTEPTQGNYRDIKNSRAYLGTQYITMPELEPPVPPITTSSDENSIQ